MNRSFPTRQQVEFTRLASRKMFEQSELLHPIQEEEKIKVENISGKILFSIISVGSALWAARRGCSIWCPICASLT